MRTFIALALFLFTTTVQAAYDHVFVVVLENVGYEAVVGSPNAPYINNQLIPRGTLYTQSYGIVHPSLPNYLALFSGSTQGVKNNKCIDDPTAPNGPFSKPNLYSRLVNNGYSITGFMETLPYAGYTGCHYNAYAAKHNPFVYFSNVPGDAWVPYTKRNLWPNCAWIIPNLKHDMHDGVDLADQVKRGDTWLSTEMPPILSYNAANNGLLILTMDEGPRELNSNHLFTLLIGGNEGVGRRNGTVIDHYDVLRMITDNFGVAPLP